MYGFSEAYDEGLEQGKEDKESELTTRAVEKCSFCNKPREEIRKLILGCGVSICDECVELCEQILREELYSKREEDE